MTQTVDSSTLFLNFLGDSPILIVDTKEWVVNFIHKLLLTMKVKDSSVFDALSFEEAQSYIKNVKPKIILCDYSLDQKCSLDLIPLLRATVKNPRDCLFILVTENTSQTTVARAAEEEVDAYVLKPFTSDALRDTIAKLAAERNEPSEYIRLIEAGKAAIAEGRSEDAEKLFIQAMPLNNSPSLACYYLGKIAQDAKNFPQAEARYNEGLTHNRIHYKCLNGLYEVYIQQKKLPEAYETIKKTFSYYPGNAFRLTELLKLSIATQNYDDIEKYYRTFTSSKDRSPDLARYLEAALLICGKYYLKKKLKSRAMNLFAQSLTSEENIPRVIKQVIASLLEFSLTHDASEFLQRYLGEKKDTLDYHVLSYTIEDRRKSRSDLILMGQDIISKGFHDPIIYQILAKRLLESGLKPAARKIVESGIQQWPDKREVFESVFTPAVTTPPVPASVVAAQNKK